MPAVHEDDALRALRAAEELREGLGPLNDELERSYGARLELRIGVNTGEVVTGTEERIATGDAVNVAARLEQAAPPGEVLVGEETLRLVRGAVEVEPAEPVAAKGKADPLTAYRLVAVRAATRPRRAGTPMVGRERQRKLLEDAFANVVGGRSCSSCAACWAPRASASRASSPSSSRPSRMPPSYAAAAVLRRGGRLLAGHGGGEAASPRRRRRDRVARGDPRRGRSAAGSPDEIAWGVRKLLEAHAAEQPLVVVFDDIHWGEPAFLDLIEHVADMSRDAPILLLFWRGPSCSSVELPGAAAS